MKQCSDQLLLDCLKQDREEHLQDRLIALSPDAWEGLLETAESHDLAPLLYYKIKALAGKLNMPATVEARFKHAYFSCAARNARLYHELVRILAVLGREHIPVIILKGAYLAKKVYENIALRPMVDIDLLVHKADLEKVWHILENEGYFAPEEEMCFVQRHLPSFIREGCVPLEIHFKILDPRCSAQCDEMQLWDRADRVLIEGVEALTLSPEDLLLHMSVHMAFDHAFEGGIRSLLDISYVLNHFKDELDWESVLARSKTWGVEKCVFITLFLSRKLLSVQIPLDIMNGAGTFYESPDVSQLAEYLVVQRESIVPSNVAKLFDDTGLMDRLKHLLKLSFPSQQAMTVTKDLPKGIFMPFLSHYYRIKGFMSAYAPIVWRLLLRDKEMLALAQTANKRNRLKKWLFQDDAKIQ